MFREKYVEHKVNLMLEHIEYKHQLRELLKLPDYLDMDLCKMLVDETHEHNVRYYTKMMRKFDLLYKRSQNNGELPQAMQQDSFDIEEIKQIPISEVLGNVPPPRAGNRSNILCPLHQEKTPSCVVYHESNTFHCFGCGKGSSVIDLYMFLHNVDFQTACKQLSASYL